MIRNYATIALRHLIRDRVFALVNLIGLSIGVGCCIIAVVYIRYELGWDEFWCLQSKKQIFLVKTQSNIRFLFDTFARKKPL